MPLRLTVPPATAVADANGDVTLEFIPVRRGRVWIGTVQITAGTPGEIVGAFVGTAPWGNWNANVSSAPIQAFDGEQLAVQGSAFPPGATVQAVWLGADYDLEREQYPILAPTQTYSPYVQISSGTITAVQPSGSNLHVDIDSAPTFTVTGTVGAVQSGPWAVSVLGTTTVAGTVSISGTASVNQAGHSYAHVAANATTNLKAAAGVLRRVVINNPGAATWSVTLHDDAGGGAGPVIAAVAGGGPGPVTLAYDAGFATGLTMVAAGAGVGDVTIVFD